MLDAPKYPFLIFVAFLEQRKSQKPRLLFISNHTGKKIKAIQNQKFWYSFQEGQMPFLMRNYLFTARKKIIIIN
jgi:hypothetical protein